MKSAYLIILLSILTGCFLSCSQEPEENTTLKSDFEDAGISASVKTKLGTDDLIAARKIDVETQNGLVELRGTVSSREEADRAVELANSIEGVRAVRSFLKIDAGSNTEESQDVTITNTVQNEFLADHELHATGIKVETSDGHVVLNGSVPSKKDEERAIQIARTVDHVKSVDSNLTVQ